MASNWAKDRGGPSLGLLLVNRTDNWVNRWVRSTCWRFPSAMCLRSQPPDRTFRESLTCEKRIASLKPLWVLAPHLH